jgi:hypothetical protein
VEEGNEQASGEFDVMKAIEEIKNNENFLKLKNVIENNSYHSNEPVYEHLLKTLATAENEIAGDFITEPTAKQRYEEFLNQDVNGVRRRDLLLVFSLIHDIGKMTIFEEDGEVRPINQIQPDGTTLAPYHEYFGSLLVRDVVGNLFSDENVEYLAKCVRLHGTFNGVWSANKDAGPEELLEKVKRSSEGVHVEQILNGYFDCFSAEPFQPAIPKIHEILNMPETYEPVKSSIMT